MSKETRVGVTKKEDDSAGNHPTKNNYFVLCLHLGKKRLNFEDDGVKKVKKR